MTGGEERPAPVPSAVRRLALPWWRARALRLAGLLERDLECDGHGAEFDGHWRSTEWLAGAAEAADAMVERLEAEEAACPGGRAAS